MNIKEMTISKRNSPTTARDDDREDYQRVFRRHVFQLIKWAYDRLDIIRYQYSEEEDISGDLGEKIDEILQDRSSPYWVGRYSVHVEKPITKSDRKGKHRQRLDIEIEGVRHGPRPRYPFEAKRLCKNTHATIGAYLGSEGLGDFLAGNYAQDRDEAGMLGYIQSDTPDIWSQKVRNWFKKNPDTVNVCTGGLWTDITILENLNYCYRSKHERSTVGKPITLNHLFLVFCFNCS